MIMENTIMFVNETATTRMWFGIISVLIMSFFYLYFNRSRKCINGCPPASAFHLCANDTTDIIATAKTFRNYFTYNRL